MSYPSRPAAEKQVASSQGRTSRHVLRPATEPLRGLRRFAAQNLGPQVYVEDAREDEVSVVLDDSISWAPTRNRQSHARTGKYGSSARGTRRGDMISL